MPNNRDTPVSEEAIGSGTSIGLLVDVRRRQSILLALLSLLLLAGLAGCTKETKWTEEVKLASGSIIVINRTARYRNYSQDNLGFGWSLGTDELRLSSGTKKFSTAVWKADLTPMLLDYDEKLKAFVLVAAPIRSIDNFQYSFFYLAPEGWLAGKLDPKYIGRTRNLLLEKDAKSAYVDLTYKAKMASMHGTLCRLYNEVVSAPFGC